MRATIELFKIKPYKARVEFNKKEIEEEERQKNTVQKQITEILAIIVLIIYLFISFTTMAWHITWILWVVYGLVEEIIKLIFMLRSKKNEK